MEVGLSRHMTQVTCNMRQDLLGEIEKKAGVVEFREQLG